MKFNPRLKLTYFLFVICFLIFSCSKKQTEPPVSPSLLNGTPLSGTEIKLTWTDNSTTEKGFKIERKSGANAYQSIATVAENTTTFTDIGLSTGIIYSYRVYAFNDGGNSPTYTNEISLETIPPCNNFAGNTVAPPAEEAMVINYLSTNGLSATELQNSGLYYIIDIPGNSKKPDQCNRITVKYVAKFANGTIFDQTTGTSTVSFTLGSLIEGFKRGMPLIGEGGRIRLIIPPALAYGANGVYNSNTGLYLVPPNSLTFFDVQLVTVN